MQRKHILAVAIALSGMAWQPAFALVEVNDCDPQVADQLLSDSNAALEEAKKTNQALGDAMQDIPSPANEGELAGAFSCIDRIKKFKVSVALGIPTEESVEEGVMNFIGNKVCTQVNKVMNQATAKINKSISFPGIPGVSGAGATGSIYVGGAGGVSVNGQRVSTPDISGASKPQFQTANPQTAQQSQLQPTVFERLTRSIRNAF